MTAAASCPGTRCVEVEEARRQLDERCVAEEDVIRPRLLDVEVPRREGRGGRRPDEDHHRAGADDRIESLEELGAERARSDGLLEADEDHPDAIGLDRHVKQADERPIEPEQDSQRIRREIREGEHVLEARHVLERGDRDRLVRERRRRPRRTESGRRAGRQVERHGLRTVVDRERLCRIDLVAEDEDSLAPRPLRGPGGIHLERPGAEARRDLDPRRRGRDEALAALGLHGDGLRIEAEPIDDRAHAWVYIQRVTTDVGQEFLPESRRDAAI